MMKAASEVQKCTFKREREEKEEGGSKKNGATQCQGEAFMSRGERRSRKKAHIATT